MDAITLTGGRIARLSIGLLAVLLAGAQASVPGAVAPHLGEPCRLVQQYPVSFATDASGLQVASFAFAGGAGRGHVQLPAGDETASADFAAYVTDVRLGSYEQADDPEGGHRLLCRATQTYHFYCPTTDTVDQFCLVWARGPG